MFIVVEGSDGAGKTVLVKMLGEWVAKELGKQVVTTREPGGTPVAEAIRNFTFATKMSLFAEAHLMFAARVEHWNDLIAPSLRKGSWVISDRFVGSTWAYQVSAGLPESFFNYLVDGLYELSPTQYHYLVSLELVLDVDFEIAQARLSNRSDINRFDTSKKSVFEARRNYYRSMCANGKNKWAARSLLIDASGTPEQTLALCISRLQEYYTSICNTGFEKESK